MGGKPLAAWKGREDILAHPLPVAMMEAIAIS
jgi:hypothetical protein